MPSVGWRLAEEISWARPERPGPEWWTLLDIAQDAKDETRQGWPGHEYLMARAKCSRATMYRRLKALTDAGLVKVVRQSAPGVRAVYEIPVIHTEPERVSTLVRPEQVSAYVRPVGTGLSGNGSQSEAERVSKTAATGLTTADSHPVTTTPSLHAVTSETSVVTHRGGRHRRLSTVEPSA
jgi:hypothetical protein